MAKTYQNLIAEARELLSDTKASTKRYTDATLLNVLNRGLHDLGKLRPDAFYALFAGNSLNVPEIVESGAGAGQENWDSVISIEMQYYSPLVTYVTAVAEIVDDEYTTDGRAGLLLNQFRLSTIGL